jgi:hypothetical protein
MKFEIYHQLGFRHQWNLQSLSDDATGDGIIIGAKSLEREKVEALPANLRGAALFDPQFFLPGVAKGQLETYNFFPQVAANDGFKSSDYADESAEISATACVQFQINSGFRYVVIPTRYMAGMPSNFIETQEELFVGPFLDAIAPQQNSPPALLQLVVTENMLKDDEYTADLLNWITGRQGIAGVYLIFESSGTSKQVKDADLLYRVLKFTAAVRENEMVVVLGYLNTESVVLTLGDPSIVTMGIYENTRSFRIRTFEDTHTEQRGPSPRLYCSQLLQWVDRNYHGALQRRLQGQNVFDQNRYQALMFQPTFKWHFTKPELYKHHFLELSCQLRTLSNVEGQARFIMARGMINAAVERFRSIEQVGIVLDQDNDGSPLASWLTAINEFAQDQGWQS